MHGRDINLRHLNAFLWVCRRGGISAAAGDVFRSQPAVTQAITRLEKKFGVDLFVRSNTGMFTTDAGKILLQRAVRVFETLSHGTRRVQRKRGKIAKTNIVNALTATHLRALAAISTHGNFSMAARAIGVSQPALYRAARDLEGLAGVPFFIKSQRGIVLTAEATALARAAGLAIGELDHAIVDINLLIGHGSGMIRLGSLPLARGTILPRALNQFSKAHPDVHIHVDGTSFDEMLHALRHGAIDLMLGALRDPVPVPDIVQEVLFKDQLGVFCGPTHPLLYDREITKLKLAGYPWAVSAIGTPTRSNFERFFEDTSENDRGSVMSSNSTVLVRGMVRDSERLTMMSTSLGREEVRLGHLRQLPIELNDPPREIGMTYRRDWRPTQLQNAFLDILRATAQSGP